MKPLAPPYHHMEFRLDETGHRTELALPAALADRVRALAKKKALPNEAVLNVLLGRLIDAADKFLTSQGV